MRRVWWLILGLGLVVVGWAIWRLGLRERRWDTHPSRIVASLPWGTGAQDVARVTGLDGASYGPLAFAVGDGVLAVADTYQQRILLRRAAGGRWHAQNAPGSQMDGLCYLDRGTFFGIDNRGVKLWRIGWTHIDPVRAWTASPTRSTSLGPLFCGGRDTLYVERLDLGQGRFNLALLEGEPSGLFRVVQQMTADQERPVSGIPVPGTGAALGPNGTWYLTGPLGRRTLTLFEYQPLGRLRRTLEAPAPVVVDEEDVLGVTGEGAVYVGLNLGRRGRSGWVEEIARDGVVLERIAVPPPVVLAERYGVVGPSGVLYLDLSTPHAYRIVAYRTVVHRSVHWEL